LRSWAAVLVLGLAAPLAACSGSADDAPAAAATAGTDGLDGAAEGTGVRTVSPAEADAVLEAGGVTLLDIRTAEEYATGHLAGARLVDFYSPDFTSRLAALDRTARYVVYCRSGNRTAQALAVMEQLGFTSVVDIAGGIQAWAADGLPVES
jgi:rhodanese-related sulfurtransferase